MAQSFLVPTALLTLFLLSLWPEEIVTAQIVPDNTLLEEDSVVSPGAEAGMLPNVVIGGGAQRDTSLFHSFEDFNVNPGQQVRFANPLLVEHIFSRVTGGQVSRIDGLLGVNGLADLFFLNPNGVIFGPNAKLDVSGSFVVTTGDRILFNDNIGFSAVNPEAPPLLNISSPIGVQFGATPQPIQVNGALIDGRPGDSFIGIGGNVTLDDTTIRMPGGQIILGGIASTGIVSLNLNADRSQRTVQFPEGDENLALADVVLQEGSTLTTIANGGGEIMIHADTVQISSSELLAGLAVPSGDFPGALPANSDFSNSLQAGNVVIEASGDVRLSDQSRIHNQVLPNALGEGGDIVISAQNLTLVEGSNILTDTASVGSAGDINVTVRDRLLLQSGDLGPPEPPEAMRPAPPPRASSPPPRPEESTRRPPPPGASSPSPRREGLSGRPTPPDILPPTAQLPPPADIPPLRAQRREFIASSSDNRGIGTTGNVTVGASQIILDGFVSVEVVTNGAGQGGNIVLDANSLEALRGGFISNLSDGPSDTGDIQIRATDINLDTRNNVAPERGGISTTLAINSNGATGGLILIETESLTVAGAQLGSVVGGQNGQGGDVVIRAGEMVKLTGDETTDATGVSSGGGDIISAVRMRGSGQGGNIRIYVPHLLVENGSEIDASVSGSGRGGSIDIQADESIILRGVLRGKPSQISTQLNQGDGGQGGDIRISTADLTVQDGGQISATTLRDGPGGQVTIQASDRIVLTGSSPNVVLPPREADAPLVLNADGTLFPSGIFASSPGLGETRSVQIRTPQLEVLDRAQISTSSKIAGTTGEIQIDADELTLNNSIISAEAVEGDGGNIELNVQDQLFLLEGSEISTAASGTASGGNIDIDDPSVVVLQGGSKISASNVSEVREADGGNVDLTADFLLSVPDGPNQILARAFGGDGGDIAIDTFSIYGDFGENLSNIDASSQRGISGSVTIQPIEIDPTRSVLELPSALADANDQIRNSCAPGERGRGSFVATGRSGLPPSPVSTLFGSMILTDLGPFVDDAVSQMGHLNSIDVPLQEARSVDIAANGTVTLAAMAPAASMMADSISVSFLIQGQVAYRAADYTGAIATWAQALQQLSSQASPEQTLLQASLWNNLALAYHHIEDWEQALQAFANSQSLLDSLGSHGGLNSPIAIAVQAQLLNTQAKLQFSTGNAQDAIASWQQAAINYRHAQDERGMVQSQLNQVQALKSLGFYQQAQQQLDDLLPQLTHTSNQGDQAIALILQSVLLQQMGDGVASRNVLANRSAAIVNAVNALNDATLASTARLNLGQLAHYQAGDETALAYYQQVIASAPTSLKQFQGQLSLLELLSTQDSQQNSLVKALLQNVSSLPANRDSLYAQLHFAWWLMNESNTVIPDETILALLKRVEQQAQQLNDRQALAYALGYQGDFYAQQQYWSQAQAVSQQALYLSQQLQAPEMMYQWYWQLGKAYVGQGNRDQAIAAYTAAVQTLKSLRGDLTAASTDLQFTFRDRVEPLYRQLVQLLLQADIDQPIPQENLKAARSLIEDLQLAELQDYFQDACVTAKPIDADTVDANAAVIYPIMLSDRLDVIVSIAGQPLKYYSSPVAAADIQQMVNKVLRSVTSPLAARLPETTENLQQLYDWMLDEAIQDMGDYKPETLVFVADGPLRTLPLAALHDGEGYLMQTYNVILSPGLELLDPSPLTIEDTSLFAGGISEARQGFEALPFVTQEVQQITNKMSTTQLLLNEQLTTTNLATELSKSSADILHLATHGKFGSSADDTFLVMWDQRLSIAEFSKLLQQRNQTTADPVELLVLSACQTATGDSRAVLGIAGMAIRAGIRSTVAGLWSLNDQATAVFMDQFYSALAQPGVTKAEAFRQAQLALLQDPRFQSPHYWSSFVMVGNWL